MNLSDILKIYDIADSNYENYCVVRHSPKEMGDYLLDDAIFSFYQSVQVENKFDGHKYILSFVASKERKTIFRGVFEVFGKEKLATSHFEKLSLTRELVKHYEKLVGTFDFYYLTKVPILTDLIGRLVIDWGGGELAWFQKYNKQKPKNILEILPAGYFKEFTNYRDISLTRSELEYLFANNSGNSVWQIKLESVDGIYLIINENTGDQYIGSASGVSGIWGRWETYSKDPTGGNERLIEKMKQERLFYKAFRYSILEVFPKNLKKDEITRIESLYKQKLGSRAFGLNAN